MNRSQRARGNTYTQDTVCVLALCGLLCDCVWSGYDLLRASTVFSYKSVCEFSSFVSYRRRDELEEKAHLQVLTPNGVNRHQHGRWHGH